MEDNKIEKYIEADLILNKNIKEKNKKIKIPNEIYSSIIKTIQENKKVVETKETIEEVKKSTKTLYEVTMKPELQEGIDCGDYIWKDYALEIRSGETGRYVGKAELIKSDALDTKEIKTTITKEYKQSVISNVTRSICSISGQIQLAEISQKLDVLNSKIDELKELIIDNEVYKLKACIEAIDKDIRLLPDSNAMNRVNDVIGELRKLSQFFSGEINKIINKKVKYRVFDSFVEGIFNVKDLLTNEIKEYNNKYVDEIRTLLEQYNFLVDCYFQSVISLGVCYQILYGYKESKEYYEKAIIDINKFSSDISNKLIYLLDIEINDKNEKVDFNMILESIKDRKIILKKELVNSNSYIENINEKHNNLTHQFNNLEIKFMVSNDELLDESE